MKLTQTNRRDIVAAIQSEKATMTELAERYKVSVQAIGYVFKKMTGNGLRHPLSQSDRKAIVTSLQSGKTTEAELAVKYGVTPNTIYRAYRKETGEPWKPKLSNTTKKTIVAELLAGTKKQEVIAKYGVSKDTVERTFKRQVGKPLTIHRKMLKTALKTSRYRAWHMVDKRMFAILGLDWLNQKVLIDTNGVPAWHDMALFKIMEYSGLRNHKGQEICVGDIVQFSINLLGNDGKSRETPCKDVVGFDNGQFILSELTDYEPLALHNDECEIIGNIYENPEIVNGVASNSAPAFP